jgi:hypothetical protein
MGEPVGDIARTVVGRTVVESRYRDWSEHDTMRKGALLSVPSLHRRMIERVFCDSKMGNSYILQVAHCCAAEADRIAGYFEAGILAVDSGHNGIMIDDA